jgi:hypothetical protein
MLPSHTCLFLDKLLHCLVDSSAGLDMKIDDPFKPSCLLLLVVVDNQWSLIRTRYFSHYYSDRQEIVMLRACTIKSSQLAIRIKIVYI